MNRGEMKVGKSFDYQSELHNLKAVVFAMVMALCLGMTGYCHFVKGTDVVFTHLFYVPIVMAGFWWPRRAVVVALILASCLLASHTLSGLHAPWLTDLLRCAIFVMVAFVVGRLKRRYEAEQQALREAQGYCDKMVRHASGPIVMWDGEGCISVFNQTLEKMTGVRAQDMIGKPVETIFPESLHGGIVAQFQRMAEGGAGEAMEAPIRGAGGDEILCVWNAANLYSADGRKCIATMGLGQDVTRVRETERALRRSEQQYRTMVEYSNDLIWTKDCEGRFDFLNRRAQEATGHSETDLFGKTCESIVEAGESSKLKRIYTESLAGRPQTFDVSVKAANGQVIDLLVNTAPVYDGDRVTGTVSFGMDVTERRRAEQARTSLQTQLCQAHKMDAVGRLAGGIAHQLNNLLTVVLGYADYALTSLTPGTALHTDVHEIRQASVRAADLIRQLLLFARNGLTPSTTVKLNDVVGGVAAMLKSQLPDNVQFSLSLEDGLWAIDGDVDHLRQILVNLALNARDAMPDGGELLVRTENVYLRHRPAGASLEMRPGKYVRLSVRDMGCGIDERNLGRIFDPFFTTKDVGQGNGLGLSVVYGIAKQHHGWVDVDSTTGEGSVFSVYLPVSAEVPPQEEGSPDIVVDACRGHGERILLIEDNEAVRKFALRGLSGNGYIVSAASDAREAEELVLREKGRFDLIFSDVVLPDESGPHVVKRLREKFPQMKAVFATGYTKGRGDWNLIEEGGYAYILKPYSLHEMLALLHCELMAVKPGSALHKPKN